jgi:hypothetical protein
MSLWDTLIVRSVQTIGAQLTIASLNCQFKVRVLRIVAKYKCFLFGMSTARYWIKSDRYFSFPSRGNGPVKTGNRATSPRQDFFYYQNPGACIPDLESMKAVTSFTY